MIESTYAWREHAEMNEEESKLVESINKTIEKWGKIIIPNFMQWRAQEINLYLMKLIKEWKIKTIPIFNHATSIKKISEIYSRNLPEVFWELIKSKNIKSAITGKWKKRQDHFDKYKGSAFLVVSWWMLDWWTIIEKLNLLLLISNNLGIKST
jgi:predicted metal-dependent RNase